MNDHAGGFVDDDDIRVLVNDGERYRVRQDLVDLRRRYGDCHDLAGRHPELRLSLDPIDTYVARIDQTLYRTAT
jgi:hypothetical protein